MISIIAILLLVGIGQQQCGRAYHIDPDTPSSATQTVKEGKILDLVMSDEFNVEGRSFESGKDSVFEAISRPDDVNQVSNTHTLHHFQTIIPSKH